MLPRDKGGVVDASLKARPFFQPHSQKPQRLMLSRLH